jgi:acyl-CoA synthetase (AMP-forming)/AMP-acid ligase II
MSFFWDELGAHGSEVALVDADGTRLSYASLAEEADRFGATLGRAALLLLEIENRSAAVVAYVGALRARVPVVLVPPGAQGTERIVAAFAPELRWSRTTGLVEVAPRRGNLHPELALALSTSGTTGATKLVRLSGRAVDANARSIAEYLGLSREERAITSLPASYCYGLSVIHSHLAVGASVVLTEASVVDDAFWDLVDREGATSFAGVPYTYELLERTRFVRAPPASLRSFTQAGGRLAVERVERFGALARAHGLRFFVMYGQTEAAPRIAYVPPDELPAHPDCIGRAIPGGHLELVDPATGEPAVGRGELVYRGPNVMMGYATSREDLGRGSELDALRTGDLAEEVAPGLFRVVGRMNRFAKLYGLRVSLDDLESRLAADGHRAFAASDDRILAVFVEGHANAAAVARAIATRLGLPESAARVVVGDERPLLSSGKTDYAGILGLARERPAAVVAQGTPAERLEEGFAGLFPGQRISDEDTFAGLGGDSLSYVAAASVVEEALGDLPAGWESLTLGELKERARAAAAAPARDRSRLRVEGEMIARCLAVTAIVVSHAELGWFGAPVRGGTDVLMLLFGFNVMRFQGPRLLAGRALEVLKHHLRIFAVPYLVLLGLAFVAKPDFTLPQLGAKLLLVSSYGWRDRSVLWFFEALLQMSILLALAFGSRRFVRAWRSWRWFPLAVVAIGAIAKVAAWGVYDAGARDHRTPDALLYLFAAGLAFAVYPRKVAGPLAALVVALELLTRGPRETHAAVMAACLALLFIPRLTVPAWLGRAIFKVTAATFYIYVASPFVTRLVGGRAGPGGEWAILYVLATFGAGLLLHTLAARLPRQWGRRSGAPALELRPGQGAAGTQA